MVASQSIPAEARIQHLVETAYRNFETDTPKVIEGCPCCLDGKGIDALLANPLRHLTSDEIWPYVSGVFFTLGSERDFKYLLPRILDIAVSDPASSIDPEIILGKVGLARWQRWPARERKIIEDFVDAWFELALIRDMADAEDDWLGFEAEGVLCGAARAGMPISGLLARLQEPDAAPALDDLKNRFPDRLSAFWEDAPEGLKELSEMIGHEPA
jgi:hypothetical protein